MDNQDIISKTTTPYKESSSKTFELVTPDQRDMYISHLNVNDTTNLSNKSIILPDCSTSSEKKDENSFQMIVDLQLTYTEALRDRTEGKTIDVNKLFTDAYQIAKLHQKFGRLEDALEYYGQALRFKNKTLSKESRTTHIVFSDILYSIGEIHMLSKFDERVKSIQSFDLCLDIRRHCYGSSHPSIAYVLYKLAAIYFSMGDKEYSMSLLSETLSMLLSVKGEENFLSEVWYTISKVQESLGQFDEAIISINESKSLLKCS